ncbi:MAG: IscS subfamily cysteine desulfurase [Rhodoferax sp.]|uniref:IscS subfamily cysteine desulfurase n=1 Tax=Rhodoferax sp. TaxID=50421 RepID=UPI0017B5926F|nr:IscS subfamily cysteine desulfurase [Rhodoferax sp.]NMM12442.1 IscS subfamily cysteine desulfurase [Rhodoferax sp.]NMM21641.1 IscS subfamily cysteine desulfurase [Rhodoferax sp.]
MDTTPHFPIYMDYSATTPCDDRVVDAMIPWLRQHFGNPASRSHAWGWEAEAAVEKAREQVAALVGADPREIVWTSGATESNNLALKGAAGFYKTKGKHIITVKTEHKAVLDTCRELERQGFEVTYLDVQADGLLDLEVFRAAIRPDTILASVMFVNNEIGVIQDIAAIGAICREKGVVFHVDAAQATGRIDIDLSQLPVDLMSLTAHKTYGPKGIGALFVRRKPRVRIEAQMHGGGHERGMRSGTLPTHQIVGMGEAYRISKEEMAGENVRIRALHDRMLAGLKDVEQVFINGHLDKRVPHNLNISFNYVEGESLIMGIKGLAVSSGSACTSASLEPSYVLRALGRSDELAHSSLRMTIGRFTTAAEIDYAVDTIKVNVAKLRDLSPLWDMYKEGIDISTIQWAAH